MFFNVSEEEHVKKEGVNFTYVTCFYPITALQIVVGKSVIHFESVVKYDKISRVIFSLPPNFCNT